MSTFKIFVNDEMKASTIWSLNNIWKEDSSSLAHMSAILGTSNWEFAFISYKLKVAQSVDIKRVRDLDKLNLVQLGYGSVLGSSQFLLLPQLL